MYGGATGMAAPPHFLPARSYCRRWQHMPLAEGAERDEEVTTTISRIAYLIIFLVLLKYKFAWTADMSARRNALVKMWFPWIKW